MRRLRVGLLLLAFILCLSSCAQLEGETGPRASVTEVTAAPTEPVTAPVTVSPGPETAPAAPEVPVYSDPITAFYDTLVYDESYGCTPFWGFLSWQEANAWEAEARHIFAYLKENAHPRLENAYLGLNMEKFEETFFAYVEKQSDLDANVSWSDLLGDKDTWGKTVMPGSGMGAGEALARTGHYRYFVESWYDTFTWLRDKTPLDCYVFSPEKALERLTRESGLEFAQGEYRLEKKEKAGEEGLENPIDGWVSQWLYMDGTTMAMASDAYREAWIWRDELCHAYEVLAAHANPAMDISHKIEVARDTLIELAPAYGDAMSLYSYSNAFFGKDQEGEVTAGSIVKSERWGLCAEYYRHETLSLWNRILNCIGRDQLSWAFDPKEHERELDPARNPDLTEEERERLMALKSGEDICIYLDEERMYFEPLQYDTGYNELKDPPEQIWRYCRSSLKDVRVEVFEGKERAAALIFEKGREPQELPVEIEPHMAGIGGLTEEDLNFDGIPDLRLFIGGERGGQSYYTAFLRDPEDGAWSYAPGFSQISCPIVDQEHHVIWGGCDFLYGYFYHAYEFVEGEFIETHSLVGDYADWAGGTGQQCTEYVCEDGVRREIGKGEYPGEGPSGAVAQYIEDGPVWEGWTWCDPHAYEMKG